MALLLMGVSHFAANAQDDFEALRKQAAGGDGKAQLQLALRYRDGKGEAKDHAEAMKWAHRAADGGHAEAMDFVGSAYLRGAVIEVR